MEEYKGGAALIWTNLSHPNTMYVYHGATKKTKDGKPEEERPLFFMKTEEGIYFSSIESALWAIRDYDEDIPEMLAHNRVCKVTNGKFTNMRNVIDREEMGIPIPYVYPVNNHMKGDNWRTSGNSSILISDKTKDISKSVSYDPKQWRETLPPKASPDLEGLCVYFHKGRYYKKAGELCEGEIFLQKKGFITTEVTIGAKAFFFFRGIMLKTKDAYEDLMSELLNNKIPITDPGANFAMYISKFSEYPVSNLPSESNELHPQHRFRWYLNTKQADCGFTPKFGGRSYVINKQGYLTEICGATKKDTHVIYTTYHEANEALKERRQGIIPFVADKDKIIDAEFVELNKVSIVAENKVKKLSIIKLDENSKFRDTYIDVIYSNTQFAMASLPSTYTQGLLAFIEEYLSKDGKLYPEEDEIYTELANIVFKACDKGITIRQAFGDVDGIIDRYVEGERTRRMITEEYNDNCVDFTDPQSLAYAYSQVSPDIEDVLLESSQLSEIEEEEIEKDAEEAAIHLDKANDTMEDVVGLLEEIRERADELQANESEFAQQCCNLLYRGVDNLKHNLAEASDQHSTEGMTKKINESINVNI